MKVIMEVHELFRVKVSVRVRGYVNWLVYLMF